MNTKKPQGPIRTEAVVPFLIVTVLTIGYFHFFFDGHIRRALEFGGYHLLGAEVNIEKLETSFFKGTFRAQGIQLTNADKPTHNIVQIGDIRFGTLWDGLLRAKLIVEEMAVEQIEIDTKRKSPGQVKPPEPPSSDSNSNAGNKIEKLKDQAIDSTKQKYSKNVLGDIAALLSGTSGDDQLKNIEDNLPSKIKLKEFDKELKEKQAKWDEKIKTLPQGKEIQSLGDRLGKVKIKDFKSPQELGDSLREIDSILKEADAKYKMVQSTSTELSDDLKKLELGFKEIDALVKKDIKDLESRFKIPKIDAKSLTMGLFQQYLDPYMAKVNHYGGLVKKYAPPNIVKKGSKDPDPQFQPKPRDKGITYEFGKPNSYPLFWIKKISISSKAGASPNSGDMSGKITDISSNQVLTNKPTVAQFAGDFPNMDVRGIDSKITIDNRKVDSLVSFYFNVGSYAIDGKDLVNTSDAQISFQKAGGSLKTQGELKALSQLQMGLDSQIKEIDYKISAKDAVIQDILIQVFKEMPIVTIDANLSGNLPDFNLDINSNLGPELQKGFQKQIQKKIDEAKEKLNLAIQQAVGKEKEKVEADYNKIKNQTEGEVKKVQDQINAQKNQAEKKVDSAKKDTENQQKKKLEQDGQKALDELKKKLGF